MKLLAEQIGRLSRASQRRMIRRIAGDSDRSFQELRALRAIDRESVQTQAMLADRLLQDPPSVSRLVDRLEKDGLLIRRAGKDRRSVRLEVTAAARKEIAHLDRGLEWLEEQAAGKLSRAELKTLKGLLEKLLDVWCALKAEEPAPTKPRRLRR